jgi:hypothetical protein
MDYTGNYRDRAERCFRLARACSDEDISQKLNTLGNDLMAQESRSTSDPASDPMAYGQPAGMEK